MSSNFIVFPFRAVSGLFCSSLERQRTKQAGTEQKAERRPEEGGRARVAARCVTNRLYRLARHRRISPERPPEPRPSGVRPKGDFVEWGDPCSYEGTRKNWRLWVA